MLLPNEKDPSGDVDPGEDGENELIEKILPGENRESAGGPDSGLYEIAKKRFNIDKEHEVAKLKKELDFNLHVDTIEELLRD